MQHENSRSQIEKNDFVSYLLSFIFTFLTLAFTSNIPVVLFKNADKISAVNAENLIQFFGKNTYFFLQLLPFLAALLVLLFCVRFIHKKSVKQLFTQKGHFNFKGFLLSFLLMGLFLLSIFAVNFFQGDSEIKWNFQQNDFFVLLAISLVFVTIQTLFEEILFRAYILQGFHSAFSRPWLSVILSSVLFGVLHLSNPETGHFGIGIVFFFIYSGLFLSLLTVYSKGIEISFGFHAVNNLFACVFLTNNWQVFQTDALFKDYGSPALSWDFYCTIFIVYPLIFIIFMKIQKWQLGSIFVRRENKISNS
jgi:membrane protease YdiL (CAAX protease family)